MDSTLLWGLTVMKMSLILWFLDVKKSYRFIQFRKQNQTESKPVGWNRVRFSFGLFFQNFNLVVL